MYIDIYNYTCTQHIKVKESFNMVTAEVTSYMTYYCLCNRQDYLIRIYTCRRHRRGLP